jgi:ribosomal protein S4E
MLHKLDGKYAPKPSGGPHKMRDCVPLVVVLRNKLRLALTKREAMMICVQKLVRVDDKIRTDENFPTGFMDVISLPKARTAYRVLYDTKGRFVMHKVDGNEAKFKLARVVRQELTHRGIPVIVTHDGRTIRYPNPDIKVGDSVRIDLATGKVTEVYKLELGADVMVTGGKNCGRVGVLLHRDRHPGSFDMVQVRDAVGHEFMTRLGNVFVVGTGEGCLVSLPRGQGVSETITQTRDRMLARRR